MKTSLNHFFCFTSIILVLNYFDIRPVWAGWAIENADSEGAYPCLALDTSGYAHIVTIVPGVQNKIKYVNKTGSGWRSEILETSANVYQPSIALDSANNPHVTYYNFAWSRVQHKFRTGSDWQIDYLPGANTVTAPVFIDSQDNIHVCYPSIYGTQNERILKYSLKVDTQWVSATVDSEAHWLFNGAIAATSSNCVHVNYFAPSLKMKYAKWDGVSWSTYTVEATGDITNYNSSIALDSQGNPYIAYYNAGDGCLKLARWTNPGFSIETVATGSGDVSMAVDSNDNIHLVYEHDTAPHIIDYFLREGASWKQEEIFRNTFTANPPLYSSLVLDKNGKPHVAFYIPSSGLKYARWFAAQNSNNELPKEEVHVYPNPAGESDMLTFDFRCEFAEPLFEINIYNMAGELVNKTEDRDVSRSEAPVYKTTWNHRNDSGEKLSSGTYIILVKVRNLINNKESTTLKKFAIIR